MKTSRFWCGGRRFGRICCFYLRSYDGRSDCLPMYIHYSLQSCRNESRKSHDISSLRSADAIRDSSDLHMSRLMISYYSGVYMFACLVWGAMWRCFSLLSVGGLKCCRMQTCSKTCCLFCHLPLCERVYLRSWTVADELTIKNWIYGIRQKMYTHFKERKLYVVC